MMVLYLLPMLMLVAGCHCAPGTLLALGGKVGYDSHMNGTIGGHLKATRDGLSINGTGNGIIGASWDPTVYASGGAQIGEHVVAGEGKLKTHIANSWEPSAQGEIGRNSNGTWLLGFQPSSHLHNAAELSPTLQINTGDDARGFMGLPVEEKKTAPQAVPMYGAPYPYGYMPMPNAPMVYMPAHA